MIDSLLYFDSFLDEILISIETKGKFLKRDDRIELKSTICGFVEGYIEMYRQLWNQKRELEEENDKLNKILYFINIYPIEVDHIGSETIELALQDDDHIKSNTFDSLRSIHSNYQWFSFIMDRSPKDIKELKDFMKEHGQAPKYDKVKKQMSKILNYGNNNR